MGNIILNIITALLSAFFVVKLSLRKFHAERWWEKKLEAYTSIINALHHIKNYSNTLIDAEIEGKKIPATEKENLWNNYKKSKQEIERVTDIGSFLIANKAVKTLKSFSKELDSSKNANSWFEHIDSLWGVTNDCLDAIKMIAKTDLDVVNEHKKKWYSI